MPPNPHPFNTSFIGKITFSAEKLPNLAKVSFCCWGDIILAFFLVRIRYLDQVGTG